MTKKSIQRIQTFFLVVHEQR